MFQKDYAVSLPAWTFSQISCNKATVHHAASTLSGASPQVEEPLASPARTSVSGGACPLLAASTALLASLFWDFSWESTVGIDLVWSPPHSAAYSAVALAGAISLASVFRMTRSRSSRHSGVRLLKLEAPLGAWVSLWGTLAFLGATLFDRWWQSNYGLVAGLWHPPQIAKTVAFFAIAIGA